MGSSPTQEDFEVEGAIVVHDIQDAIDTALHIAKSEDIFFIGGATIYKQCKRYCDTAYVTKVHRDGNADTFIDNLDEDKKWILLQTRIIIESKLTDYKFLTYKRILPNETY